MSMGDLFRAGLETQLRGCESEAEVRSLWEDWKARGSSYSRMHAAQALLLSSPYLPLRLVVEAVESGSAALLLENPEAPPGLFDALVPALVSRNRAMDWAALEAFARHGKLPPDSEGVGEITRVAEKGTRFAFSMSMGVLMCVPGFSEQRLQELLKRWVSDVEVCLRLATVSGGPLSLYRMLLLRHPTVEFAAALAGQAEVRRDPEMRERLWEMLGRLAPAGRVEMAPEATPAELAEIWPQAWAGGTEVLLRVLERLPDETLLALCPGQWAELLGHSSAELRLEALRRLPRFPGRSEAKVAGSGRRGR